MSVICQTFVQNAWRSDLCSNCFKCLAEHSDTRVSRMATPRYMPQATSLYQSRGISSTLKWRLSEPIYERVAKRDFASQTPSKNSKENRGILINGDSAQHRKLRSRSSVDFASEEALVIGYGGNDYDSDQSPWEMGSDDGSIDFDLLDDTDEDRSITRLTRNNTEFNSSNRNLLSSNDKTSSVNNSKNCSTALKRESSSSEKLSCNNNNNNSKNSVQKDKSLNVLNVTYNDIQPEKVEKKLNTYYFSTHIEPMKSYLHNSKGSNVDDRSKNNQDDVRSYLLCSDNLNNTSKTNNEDVKSFLQNSDTINSLTKSNKDQIKSYANNKNSIEAQSKNKIDDVKVGNAKRDSVKSNNSDSCRNLLNDDFSPLNTRTYSFVSELHKNSNNTSSDHNSDSDYSTCRLTAGDSTDSESFQDAEEPARILPCPSFLHGNYPKVSQQPSSMDSLDCLDKKYDGGSSTSGDVSNLSDDSDAQESSQERTYKSRILRSLQKTSPINIDNKKPGRDSGQLETEKLSSYTIKPDIVNSSEKESGRIMDKRADVIIASSPQTTEATKVQVNESTNKLEKKKLPDNEGECKQTENKPVNVSIESQADTKIPSEKLPNPNPPVDVNLRNIIAVNGNTVSPKASPESERPPSIKSSPPQKIKSTPDSTPLQKSSNESAPITNPPSLKQSSETSNEKAPSDEDEVIDYDRSPEAINNRQSKLAALALELELARRDSDAKSNKAPPPLPPAPPEVKAKCSPRTIYSTNPVENFPTIKKGGSVSCASRLAALPDVLQQQPQQQEVPQKTKKNRFSLKKLLKRSKDNSGTFAPAAAKNVNPKAWKKQTFDRSRLSLEIVHPMDLASDASGDSPTEEVSGHPRVFKGGYSRARSLSALPQLCGETQDPCMLVDCRKTETMPARKAGTVAERKKHRPSLVRTPSCSALPNRPTVIPVTTQERTPPPKPPPPPKGKGMQPPPPPPHQPRITKPPSCTPARPPPPKIPEIKSRIESGDSCKPEQRDSTNCDKEYANLGDIRSLLTPKKPQRPSAVSVSRDNEKTDVYETLQAADEEEDHYTYLDEAEMRMSRSKTKMDPASSGKANGRPWLDLHTSYAAIAAANYEALAEIITASMNEVSEYFQNGGKSLRWKDFSLEEGKPQQLICDRIVYTATHAVRKGDKVLLMVTPKQLSAPQQNTRNQVRHPVLASFSDHVPRTDGVPSWSSIYVLRQSRILSVAQFARDSASDTGRQHIHLRDFCFLLLQLIHTLKSLQAEGVEDIQCDLERLLVLLDSQEDKPPVFVLFPEDKAYLCDPSHNDNRKTLCQATLSALCHFLQVEEADALSTSCNVNGEFLSQPVAHTFQAIAKVLAEEKASSLSQAKGLLEYMLWGPVDVKISDQEGTDILDGVLQRWLDLQRAQIVKSTISQLQQKVHFHVYEEYQLIFLLQASVKSLKSVISKL